MSHQSFHRFISLILALVISLSAAGFTPASAAQGQPQSLAAPDLNAAYISRFPRYEYDATPNQPAPGDPVQFEAHIANRGGQDTGPFTYRWFIDGAIVMTSTHPGLSPGETATLSWDWTWQTGTHRVMIHLDSSNAIPEVSETNNSVVDQTNALAVGFWVEQSVYDWFNLHQVELGMGSVSWEDWAQRQLRAWNTLFATSVHPLTPDGILERVRLDQVTVIPDGTWPDCANGPFPEDKFVDLVWGFPSELVGVASGRTCPPFNFYINNPDFQRLEPSLLHEMSHARYLVDLYGLNVYVHNVILSNQVGARVTSLTVAQDVESDGRFPLPAYLAVDGELIICQSKSSNTFLNCARGAEGTTARSHAAGTVVHLATVRIQDGNGNLVQGSPGLPVVGDFSDHLYFNRYPDDMMSSTSLNYGQHSAFAWNRILGQRPVCGNANAPCNIGEYLNDIPQQNILEIRDSDGKSLPGIQVDVYRPKPFEAWYGRVFLNTPDATYTTDAQGRVDLGNQPFEPGASIVHTYGYSNALLLLKISTDQQEVYRFFEVTEANEAYWFGYQDSATYILSVPSGSTAGLDPAFGIQGKVRTDFFADNDFGRSAALQPDGKILVVGLAFNGMDDDFALSRYNPDGSLDTSFGDNGKVTLDLTPASLININTATVAELESLPGIGPTLAQQIVDYRIANGPFDSIQHIRNVPGMGPTLFDQIKNLITVGDSSAYGLRLQPDGKILVGGYSGGDFALARHNSDGSLDMSFHGDGFVLTDFGNEDYGLSLAIQPDGKIIMGGNTIDATRGVFNWALARYNSDGSLDTSFEGDGKVITHFSGEDLGRAIALQPDGKIVMVGQSFVFEEGYNFALARYNPDGSLDSSFGTGGKLTTNINGSSESDASSVAIQPDGKLIVAGWTNLFGNVDFALARYHNDGSLDVTFGTNGITTTDLGSTDFAVSVVLTPEGKLLTAGNSRGDFALARYDENGSLGTGFSFDGTIITDFGNGEDAASALLLQPDNKIILAGTSFNGSDHDFALARYLADAPIMEVSINIKPNSQINHIAPRSRGRVRVAILSSSNFNPLTMIDANTLTFGRTGEEESLVVCKKRGRDVNHDGWHDLICDFSIPATGFQKGDALGILKGQTLDGTLIIGSDVVMIGRRSE